MFITRENNLMKSKRPMRLQSEILEKSIRSALNKDVKPMPKPFIGGKFFHNTTLKNIQYHKPLPLMQYSPSYTAV